MKLDSLNNSVLKSPIVLTLAVTSLLSCGLGFIGETATAFPGAEQISGDAKGKDFVLRISQLSESPDQISNRLPKRIANAILSDASNRSGVSIAELQITQATPKTFANPCIFNFGEICTREYRPIKGWEVIVQVREQSWTYHVDISGSQIVLDPKVSVSEPATLPAEIQDAILHNASERSGVPTTELQITQVTPKTFGNPCEFNFGEICTREFNPVEGWFVVVRVGEQSWTYHVNQSGSQIVLDPQVSGTSTNQ